MDKKGSRDNPRREMLINLGRMSKPKREEHTWFWLYLWEARKQSRTAEGRAKRFFLTANEVIE
jgi:hypothetical protein